MRYNGKSNEEYSNGICCYVSEYHNFKSHFNLRRPHTNLFPFLWFKSPMMQSVGQGWGSCPIQGRDWGTSDPSDQAVTEKLMRKLEQSRADAGR